MTEISFHYDDGGRAAAGFKSRTGDCVVRAIAIATEQPYQQVYDHLGALTKHWSAQGRTKAAKGSKSTSVRSGVHREVFKPYLLLMGWKWTPTMKIGQGCKVHLKADELPSGRLICSVSRHLVAVIDGVIHDNHDPSRGGSRCVYGFFSK